MGNAAGAGTIYALLSEDKLTQACDIARTIQYIELSSNASFTIEYTENMFLVPLYNKFVSSAYYSQRRPPRDDLGFDFNKAVEAAILY